MRVLLPLAKKKRGLSNIIAYVLLISITISLSVLVYGWLRFYVGEEEIETCSNNVNIIIRSYECYKQDEDTLIGGRINVTLKNKGLFNVDGYTLRVHTRSDAEFGIYLFDDEGAEIAPGVEYSESYNFNDSLQDIEGDGTPDEELLEIKFIEVQPFVKEEGSDNIHCKSYASQVIECV